MTDKEKTSKKKRKRQPTLCPLCVKNRCGLYRMGVCKGK